MWKQATAILFVLLTGFVCGRLCMRALMNRILGGTLFGGNIL